MAKIKVYPMHAVGLRAHSGTTNSGWKLGHPRDGELREGGSWWEDDSFTYRAMKDGDITTDEAAQWRRGIEPGGIVGPAGGPVPEQVMTTLKKPKLDAV